MTSLIRACASVMMICMIPACGGDDASNQEGRADESAGDTATDTGETDAAEADTEDDEPESGGEANDEEGGGEGGAGCGNEVIEPGEDCDGSELGGQACTDLGFVAGELSCDDRCHLDATDCSDQLCGNGVREGDEECDGTDLGGTDCEALEIGMGVPSCTGECTLDTSACGEGESCNLLSPCPNDLNCVSGSCYDGSAGDPCDTDNHCQSSDCVGATLFDDGTCS
jgi:hypothetical protein